MEQQAAATQKLRRESQGSTTTPPAHEHKAWNWELALGHYFASEKEMLNIRVWFLGGAWSPPVVLRDAGSVRTLLYTCTAKDKFKGSICVVAPPEFEQINEWLAELDVSFQYTGTGLPNINAQVRLLLVKRGKPREYQTGKEKAKLLEVHGHVCALCGQKTSTWEFDHIIGFRQFFAGQEHVFQPVCPPCHQLKTDQEGKSLCLDFMASQFECGVWGAYVMSA